MTATLDRLAAALADRYRIERELGAGGMATVYLAHDLRHDRDVAIKVLHPDLAAALGGERFLSEIRTTARLQHPHILPLLDSGEADGLLYYVMPLVTGETLRTRLERDRQLAVADALLIAREVADALGYAHGLGVIHRDIKPENILLQGGHALVADFGIALAVQSAGGQRMTQTGLSLGTPQYMSPEQAMGEKHIDARSDIYALGAVTYEMLVGEPPFTGPSVQAIVARLVTEEPRAIGVQRKAVPEHVEAAVLHALEKLPADRFASAGEFAAALRDGSATIVTTSARRRSPAPAPIRPWARPALWGGLIAGGAVLGWLASRLPGGRTVLPEPLTETSILAPAGGNFGEQRSLALSPDGRRLAFVFAAGNGSRNLWLRQLDRLDAAPVPGTDGANAPFWSPDGRSIGFFADGFLTVVDESGNARRLCPVAGASGGSWSTRGLILFSGRDGISTVPADGGQCRLVVPRGDWLPSRAVFLPDGAHFLYARGRQLDMVVADLDGKSAGTIPVRTVEVGFAAPDYLIAPTETDLQNVDVQRMDLSTFRLIGAPIRLASNVRSQSGVPTFAVSAGDAVAFLPGARDRPYLEYDAGGLLRDTVRVEATWTLAVRPPRAGPPLVAVAGNAVGVWLYDLGTNRATRLATHDTASAATGQGKGVYPVFNTDGSHLAFLRVGPVKCRIMDHDLRTDAERLILEVTAPMAFCPIPLSWSPDGAAILVRRDSILEVVSARDGATTFQITRPGRTWEGSFAPDGRAIAFSSDETGRAEIYVQPLPSGTAVRISLEGGRWPNWTGRGRTLTFVTPDGRVQEAALDAAAGGSGGTPRTRFSIPTWRRSTFDDAGAGFGVVGDGERYIVRQSPTGLAVAYVQHWSALFRRPANETGGRP